MSEVTTKQDPVVGWWLEHLADRDSGSARGLSARLRRANPSSAIAEPAVHTLAKRLGFGPDRADELIRLVQVLAHVRGDHRDTLAKRVGGQDAALSHLRFQRLMRANATELAPALRRVIPMADRTCNVRDLAWLVRLWDHPERGDSVRARWAFDYFDGPSGVPSFTDTSAIDLES